jgi:hypothetical protein
MAKYILIERSNPVPGKEQEYNDWYNNEHLPDLMTVPGIVAARRWKVVGKPYQGAEFSHRYICVYQIETDDIDKFLETLVKCVEAFNVSDAIDLAGMQTIVFRAITDRVEAAA